MKVEMKYEWPCKYCEFIGCTRRELQKHHKDFHGFTRYKFPKLTKGTHLSDDVKNKISQALKGVSTHAQTIESRLKISQTARKNKLSGGYRYGSGRGKKGWYKGYWCDSSWELAFVIYNLEHGIDNFSKNFNKKFKYELNGETHFYVPDFEFSDGHFVEIKGRRETDECIEAKLKSVTNITILFEADMKKYLDYTIDKYGKDFIKLYEVRK